MAATEVAPSPPPVRIAQIAGRYLVFDAEAASALRRQVNTNGVLVGTAPQQPTQNIFLGLPVELRPEEVEALVRKDAAYVVDDVAAHRQALQSYSSSGGDPSRREAYIESLRRRKRTAQSVLAEKSAQKAAAVAAKLKRKVDDATVAHLETAAEDGSGSSSRQADAQVRLLGVTPTASSDFVPTATDSQHRDANVAGRPLCRFLQDQGYYMTPGLRFGASYSVYPGDPLRFHAHFMANQYDWDQPVPILDIVGGGRLATAVKKAFVIGAEQPGTEASPEPQVRTFSIEWAAM
ncbi:tRNA-splicing endonuclease subunit [Lecanicillium sp. MT-2017a]|nr:tRNA-splicing endonuclease subunit [Lecanicillium sp. MT-2017a]